MEKPNIDLVKPYLNELNRENYKFGEKLRMKWVLTNWFEKTLYVLAHCSLIWLIFRTIKWGFP